jgi:hypothetical protein
VGTGRFSLFILHGFNYKLTIEYVQQIYIRLQLTDTDAPTLYIESADHNFQKYFLSFSAIDIKSGRYQQAKSIHRSYTNP